MPLQALTYLVLRTQTTRILPRLLMPWLLVWPGHQQPWHWIYTINRSLSSSRKDFNYLHHLSGEKWFEIHIHIYPSSKTFKTWSWPLECRSSLHTAPELGHHCTCRCPGPCLTTAIWRCRKPFSQWHRSFQRKLRSHWLKFLRQRHVAVVRQGPGT